MRPILWIYFDLAQKPLIFIGAFLGVIELITHFTHKRARILKVNRV